MPCYSPIEAFQSPKGGALIFYRKPGYTRLEVPCNYCVGCKTDRKLQWTVRSLHEASQHEENSFITLTYDDDQIPPGFSLVKKDLADFIKRLRARIEYYYPGRKIKFRACGEYGDNTFRPHYHLLVHGFMPDDIEKFNQFEDYWTYTSEIIDDIWGKGFALVADVTKGSAAYVNGYLDKKFMYQDYEKTHGITDPRDGQFYVREPEYVTTSQGYGKKWFEQFKTDCYPSDSVILDAKEVKVPAYYDRLLKIDDPELLEKMKQTRKEKALKRKKESQFRLDTIAEVKTLNIIQTRDRKKGKL